MQALQGLPGFGGSQNGIGIGFGLQQLAQARAQSQLSAQQAAFVSNGLLSSHPNGPPSGYHPGSSVTNGDSSMQGKQPPMGGLLPVEPAACRIWLSPRVVPPKPTDGLGNVLIVIDSVG